MKFIAGIPVDSPSNCEECEFTDEFVILGFDGPDGMANRKVHRPDHLKNMEKLDAEQRVVLAGPLTDGAGSPIVITADSLAEAEAFAKSDAYMTNGVFKRIEVHPFQQVFPKEKRDA